MATPPLSPRNIDYVPSNEEPVQKNDSHDSQSNSVVHGHSQPPSPHQEVNPDPKISSPYPSPSRLKILDFPTPPISPQHPVSPQTHGFEDVLGGEGFDYDTFNIVLSLFKEIVMKN